MSDTSFMIPPAVQDMFDKRKRLAPNDNERLAIEARLRVIYETINKELKIGQPTNTVYSKASTDKKMGSYRVTPTK